MADLFATLRTLMLDPPSARLWKDLCLLLERAQGEAALSTMVEYAERHLEAWPDELRVLRNEELLQWRGVSCLATPEELGEELSHPERLTFWPLVATAPIASSSTHRWCVALAITPARCSRQS